MVEESIKKGYRQTEVGIIPKDWTVKELSQFGEVKRGAGSQFIKYVKHGLRLIRINDFFEDNPVFVENTQEIMRFAINEQDVLFAGTGASAGESFIPKKEWIGNLHSYNAPRIRVKKDFSKEYLLYSLQSNYVRKQMQALFVGAAQPFLDITAISNLKIATPPTIKEQSYISQTLSEINHCIHSLTHLIKKKKNIKQGTMQGLLTGKRRLEGFSEENEIQMVKDGFQQTEIGKIPDDWTIKKIKEFTDATSGGTPSTFHSEYWNGKIRWMNSGEINLKKIYEVKGRITELGLKNSSTKLIPKNCILIALAGQGKTRGTVAINYVELCINQSLGAILPNKLFSSEYVYHNLDSRYDELRSLSSGGEGRGGLNLTLIKNINIPFPPTIE